MDWKVLIYDQRLLTTQSEFPWRNANFRIIVMTDLIYKQWREVHTSSPQKGNTGGREIYIYIFEKYAHLSLNVSLFGRY